MFGGLTKTSSRIALAAALGLVLGVFAMGTSPAKAADLGGDCCADLEERVAELEATTVRKGNKKVSVTLSGWVVKLGSWWDDGHEQNFYVGDKDTTLSSHFQISGSAQISPGWSAGYTIAVEVPGNSASVGFCENQFDDNCAPFGDINTLLSYMWIKSDKYGTLNWGQLSQATDNVALLPDLSGTIIESNAVLFDGAGMFVRVKGAVNSNDMLSEFSWGSVLTCLGGGGGLAADCNGYPDNAVRYDTPTWAGFSAVHVLRRRRHVGCRRQIRCRLEQHQSVGCCWLHHHHRRRLPGIEWLSGTVVLASAPCFLVVAARPSRTPAEMWTSGRLARLSCTSRRACGSTACGSRKRTTARS